MIDARDYQVLVCAVRQAVGAGLREALDDLRVQQAVRPRFLTLAQAARLQSIGIGISM